MKKLLALLVVTLVAGLGCDGSTPTTAPQPNADANKQVNPAKQPGGKQAGKLNGGKEGD